MRKFRFIIVSGRVAVIRSTFALLSFLASLGLAAATPAGAGERRVAQSDLIDGLYLESTGQAVFIDAPAVEGLGIYAGESFLSGDPIHVMDEGRVHDVGGGWDGRLGFQLPGGPEGWNLELGGSYAHADSETQSNLKLSGADAFTPVAINGRVPPELGFLGVDQTLRQRFSGDVKVWDTRIGVAIDFEVDEFLAGKARAGLVGGRIEQDYDISHKPVAVGPNWFDPIPFFRAIPSLHRLNEHLDSYFVGPYLGMSLEAQLTSRLSVTLDTELALLYNNAELQASQDVVGFYFQDGPGPGALCATTNDNCNTPESDRESAFGVRPRIRVGFDLDLGPFVLGVSGGATYWSYAPQVVNPQFVNFADSLAGAGEAHVSGDDMLIADLGVKLTIPFGRHDMAASSATAFGAAAGEALDDLIEGLYFENTGYAVHLEVPAVEGLGLRSFDGNQNGFRDDKLEDEGRIDDWGGGWEGLLGFDLPVSMPGDDGGRWSVELGGSYARAQETVHDFQDLGNNEFIYSIPINGQPRIGLIGFEQDVRQTFDGEVELWDVRLGLARDLGLVEGLISRIKVGLVGGLNRQDYVVEQEATELDLVGIGFFLGYGGQQRIDESVKDRFVGPYLGFTLETQLLDRLSVHLDTEVALLYTQARFKASQEVAANTLDASPHAPCDLLSGSPHPDRCGFTYKESEVSNQFGARPRMRLGFDLDLGAFMVGVSGGVTYWSYASQIVNGEAGAAFGGPGFQTEKAHVSGDDMLAGDVGLKITIPLR